MSKFSRNIIKMLGLLALYIGISHLVGTIFVALYPFGIPSSMFVVGYALVAATFMITLASSN